MSTSPNLRTDPNYQGPCGACLSHNYLLTDGACLCHVDTHHVRVLQRILAHADVLPFPPVVDRGDLEAAPARLCD